MKVSNSTKSYIGFKSGNLIVHGQGFTFDSTGKRKSICYCECKCGNVCEVLASNISKGNHTTQCIECSRKNRGPKISKANKGRKNTIESRRKMSKSQQKRADEGRCPLTIDGKGYERLTERKQEMSKVEYKIWRDTIFQRDNYQCQFCSLRGCELHVDHIKPWSQFPELRYDINNGRTLCVECHKKTDTYGGKSRRKPL